MCCSAHLQNEKPLINVKLKTKITRLFKLGVKYVYWEKKRKVSNTGNNQTTSVVCRQKKKGTILFMIHRRLAMIFFQQILFINFVLLETSMDFIAVFLMFFCRIINSEKFEM